jgi:hypothetical protein
MTVTMAIYYIDSDWRRLEKQQHESEENEARVLLAILERRGEQALCEQTKRCERPNEGDDPGGWGPGKEGDKAGGGARTKDEWVELQGPDSAVI